MSSREQPGNVLRSADLGLPPAGCDELADQAGQRRGQDDQRGAERDGNSVTVDLDVIDDELTYGIQIRLGAGPQPEPFNGAPAEEVVRRGDVAAHVQILEPGGVLLPAAAPESAQAVPDRVAVQDPALGEVTAGPDRRSKVVTASGNGASSGRMTPVASPRRSRTC